MKLNNSQVWTFCHVFPQLLSIVEKRKENNKKEITKKKGGSKRKADGIFFNLCLALDLRQPPPQTNFSFEDRFLLRETNVVSFLAVNFGSCFSSAAHSTRSKQNLHFGFINIRMADQFFSELSINRRIHLFYLLRKVALLFRVPFFVKF